MLELRILNGLHRGATLPLDDGALTLGSSDDADVVLVDPGIEARHAALAPGPGGWTLTAQDGAVLGMDDNRALASLELRAGGFARLDHVWIMLADSEAPWENPPPEPADGPAEAPDAQAGAMSADEAPQAYEPYSEEPAEDLPQDAAPAAPVPASASEESAARPVRPRWRRSRPLLGVLALATFLSACAAYTMSNREAPAPETVAAPLKAKAARPKLADLPAPRPEQDEARLGPEELREAFRKRLKEVDLLKRFQLDLGDHAWNLRAALDDEEAARFERILTSFVQAHDIKFPVHVKIGGAEAMLPFRIREVVSGANASVVTGDGKRLYVGDEYHGVRLVAVESDLLRFEGDRKIKVKW